MKPAQRIVDQTLLVRQARQVNTPAPRQAVSWSERALIAYARHFPLNLGKYRLVNALWRRFAGPDHARVARLVYGGLRVPCDLGELIQRQLYFFGTYYLEREYLAVWQGNARQARVVFDVGANAGIYSLAASSANPEALIHAFEPTPEIAARLDCARVENAIANLVVAELAVSDVTGFARLVRYDGDGDNGGMNFIVSSKGEGEDCAVATTTLDQYCREHAIDRVDLVKVDVQGLEAAVFRGAKQLLDEGKIGTVFIELNWAAPGESSPADEVVSILDSCGFAFSAISLRPRWRQAGPWLREHADIMARKVSAEQRG